MAKKSHRQIFGVMFVLLAIVFFAAALNVLYVPLVSVFGPYPNLLIGIIFILAAYVAQKLGK